MPAAAGLKSSVIVFLPLLFDLLLPALVAHGHIAFVAAQKDLLALGDDAPARNSGIDGRLVPAGAYGLYLGQGVCDLKKAAAAGEQVMLQGVVDCFWQEADGIVILDFKTDYIDGDLQLKAARYVPQLQAYARALSLIYGLSVRKCIHYFFSAGKAVEIDPE